MLYLYIVHNDFDCINLIFFSKIGALSNSANYLSVLKYTKPLNVCDKFVVDTRFIIFD